MWVRIWPHLALLLAMVFWSTSYVALRIALSALDPFTVMAGRMGVATLLFLPLWGGLLRDLRRKGQWRWLLLMAFAEPCCYFLLETRALCLTTASQAGMIISLLPLITAVVAWRLLGERVSLRGWIGFALAVAGVVWLSLQSAVDETATAPVLGNFFEGLAMVCAALYTVLARRLSAAYSPLQITAVQSFVGMSFFAGLLALAPLDYTPVLLHVEVPDWAPWASVVYLGGVVSLGGYGLYNVGGQPSFRRRCRRLHQPYPHPDPGQRRHPAARGLPARPVHGLGAGGGRGAAQPVGRPERPARG